MFRLNREVKTNSGEIVKPYLVENKTVYCFNSAGKTIFKSLTDFNFEKSKDNISSGGGGGAAIKMVSPTNKNVLFEEPNFTIGRPTLEQEEKVEVKPVEYEAVTSPVIDDDGGKEIQTGGVRVVEPAIKEEVSYINATDYTKNDDYI